jgi:hypothetical protein
MPAAVASKMKADLAAIVRIWEGFVTTGATNVVLSGAYTLNVTCTSLIGLVFVLMTVAVGYATLPLPLVSEAANNPCSSMWTTFVASIKQSR